MVEWHVRSAAKDATGRGRYVLRRITQRSSGVTSKITKNSRGIPGLRMQLNSANCTQLNDVYYKPTINFTESLNQARVDKQNRTFPAWVLAGLDATHWYSFRTSVLELSFGHLPA
jgi:hypothetical protein